MTVIYKNASFIGNQLFSYYGIEYHFYEGAYTKTHKHKNHWELFLVTNGKLVHNYRRKQSLLEKNTFCIMRPNDEHSFSSSNGTNAKHISIAIDDTILRDILSAINPDIYPRMLAYDGLLSLTISETQVGEFFKNMQSLLASPFTENDFISTTLKVKFVELIEMMYSAKFRKSNNYPDIIKDAIELMQNDEYIGESLDVICQKLPYSHRQLLNAFKKYTGKTMIKYFTELKLEKAYNLLVSTNYKILYICCQVGFDSISYFNKQFKLKYGITPSSVRS